MKDEVSRETFVAFELPGEPRGWERPGATVRRGRIHWYVRAEEERYRNAIGWAAKAAMGSREPTSEPVALLIHAFMPIPVSWSLRKKQDARTLVILPTGKPDFDNIAKVVADSLAGIVWKDDAAVCDGHVTKCYGDHPGLRVEVREIKRPAVSRKGDD